MYYSLKKIRASSALGFTLIELLVVIAIIGVLASTVLASLNSARAKARDARRLADIKEIEKALQFYYDANGRYPDVTGGGVGGWEVSYLPDFMEYLQPYISRTPTDPINSGPPSSLFSPRPDGTFFYTYYHYLSGTYYGCPWSGPFAVLGFRSFEKMNPATLPKARCGPQTPPCLGGGTANVCRDWSTEFDYSIFLVD